MKQSAPNYGIGSAKRRPLAQVKDTPGPGNYAYKTLVDEGPKYIMGTSRFDKKKDVFPGPGTYVSSDNPKQL